MKKHLYYSTAYYPELWDEREMDNDIKYMQDLGINTIRIGEFAWSSMEKKMNQIDLSFFRRVIEKFYANGIYTILCTPTATPPIWMTHKHPERLFVNEKGTAYIHGARQHMCTNNYFFRERVGIIVERMSKELGDLPGVIGWQIDNEMKSHVSECYCETCKIEWGKWLENKYKTIENLNEAWGTRIWSEEYDSFDQVPQPFETPFLHNASLTTNYKLFSMEEITTFSNMQINHIKKYNDKEITHNTGLSFSLNNESIFEKMNFVSFDAYPTHKNYMHLIFQYDLWRSLKRKTPFWLMETSPAHGGSIQRVPSPHPRGFLKAEAISAFAAGAGGFSYWLWRGQRAGCELPHAALLYSWGKPALGYNEAKEIGNEVKKIEHFITTTEVVQAEVALMYSDIAKTFFKTEPLEKIDYMGQMKAIHEAIVDKGIFRDVIYPGTSLEGYKLVMTPYMPHIPSEVIDKLEVFAKHGGTWIVGPMSGYRTEHHTALTDCAIGKIESLAGICVKDFYSAKDANTTIEGFGQEGTGQHWVTTLDRVDSKEKATIRSSCHDAKTVISERTIGKGKIVVLGVLPNQEMMQEIIDYYCKDVGVVQRYDAKKNVLIIPRQNGEKRYSVVVNMTETRIEKLMIKGKTIELEPYGYKIIED